MSKIFLSKLKNKKNKLNSKTNKLSIKNGAKDKPKKIRDEKCACEVCGKTFSRKSYMTTHMQMHSGENNYSCDICSKSFFTKQYLDVHCNAVHAGLKPFKCNLCDVSFGDPRTLLKHKKILHVTCKYCQKVMTKRLLNPHYEKFHSGELPFQCNQCKGKFSSARKLRDHKNNSHSGKIYCQQCRIECSQVPSTNNAWCSNCSKEFKAIESFPCSICSKVCFSRASLNSHLHNYH